MPSLNGPFTRLQPPPKVDNPIQWARWYDQLYKILAGDPGIAWDLVSKAGSELSDIQTRPHSDLQDIIGNGEYHLSQNETNEVIALDGLGNGMVAKTGNATYAARTITGTSGEVEIANGDGSGNPTIGLPDIISTPRKFGDSTNNTTFEADGTAVFNGAATVWKDIMFPMAPPKTTGVGNPSLVTWNGNLRGYSFAVNDVHDFDPQEIEHDAKVGSTATWHLHWISRTNVAADRAVKYQIEFAIEPDSGAYAAPTTISAEFTIPANTPVNTPYRSDIGTFTIPTIAREVHARLTRIAAAGTAPANDPIISGLHFHYELDTIGSRQITAK